MTASAAAGTSQQTTTHAKIEATMSGIESRPCLGVWGCVTLVMASAAACSQPGEPPTEPVARPAIEVERDTAVLRAQDEKFFVGMVVATYTNRTRRPVYLGRCGLSRHPGFTLDKKVRGAWTASYDPICDLIGAPPIEVRPGGSRTDTLPLRETRWPTVYPNFHSAEIPGTYRVVYEAYGYYANRQLAVPLPRAEHVSEPFRIELVP